MSSLKSQEDIANEIGIRQGNNQHTTNGLTQEDIANELNISTKDLQRYKKLTTLIPELQNLCSKINLPYNTQLRQICQTWKIQKIVKKN